MSDHAVLVVEDRPAIAQHLEQAVTETPGVRLAGSAGTLDQGMQLLYSLKPRLVLVDIGLPDGSGLDLVAACSSADWTVDSLIVSIFGDEARVIAAIQAGASGYVLKGGDLSKISQDIQSVLAGGSPISPGIARHLLTILKTASPATKKTDHVLTERETEILQAVARGFKRHEIADRLGITPGTVSNHITRIYRKLGVNTNIEAVLHATRIGAI